MEEKIKIEKNVPVPSNRKHKKIQYPFFEMEVGDSFLIADGPQKFVVRAAAYEHAKRHGGKFMTRTTPDGVRVWRTK